MQQPLFQICRVQLLVKSKAVCRSDSAFVAMGRLSRASRYSPLTSLGESRPRRLGREQGVARLQTLQMWYQHLVLYKLLQHPIPSRLVLVVEEPCHDDRRHRQPVRSSAVTRMARSEYLVRRESNAPPPGATFPETLYRLCPVGTVLRSGRNQVRNHLAVSGYGDGLAVPYRPEEFGQARLGFRSLNPTHI